VWAIQGSESSVECDANFRALNLRFPAVGDYLDGIPRKAWVSYAQNDTGACTHAQRTSQCVESLNAKLLPHRKKTPLLALESLVLSLQHDYKTASEAMNAKIKARENDGIATNISDFYHGLFTSQVLQLGRFVANRKNDDIKGYVQRRGEPSARFNIDLRQKIPCNCGFTAKHRIDCVHTLIFRLAGNASILLNNLHISPTSTRSIRA